MNKHYLIPILSISLFFLFVLGGNITGFVTFNQQTLATNILLTTTADDILPADATITVDLAGQTGTLTAQQFIEKTGIPAKKQAGQFKQINFTGEGYTGEHTYSLPLQAFNINPTLESGNHSLLTTITYHEQVIASQHYNITAQ